MRDFLQQPPDPHRRDVRAADRHPADQPLHHPVGAVQRGAAGAAGQADHRAFRQAARGTAGCPDRPASRSARPCRPPRRTRLRGPTSCGSEVAEAVRIRIRSASGVAGKRGGQVGLAVRDRVAVGSMSTPQRLQAAARSRGGRELAVMPRASSVWISAARVRRWPDASARRPAPAAQAAVDRRAGHAIGDDLDRGRPSRPPPALPARHGGQCDHRIDRVQRIDRGRHPPRRCPGPRRAG